MQLSQYLPRIPFILGILCIAINQASFSHIEAVIIPVGAGGYTTDLPAGQLTPSDRNNAPTTPKTVSEFTQVPQTNDWWSSLIWKFNPENPWSENLFAHPFSFKAQAGGLEIGYPTQYFLTPYDTVPSGHKVQEYHYPHTKDLILGMVGLNSPDTRVGSYSDWTVTPTWIGNGQTMQATIGSGLPFVYVTQAGGNAMITLSATPIIWSNTNGVIGLTINSHHYGIFGPMDSIWTNNGSSLQSNLNEKNYYSVAVLPDNQPTTLELFRQHAYAFVTDTKVNWNYDEPTATLTTVYTAQTILKEPGPNNSNVNRALLALYRHQWLNSNASFLPFTYASPRGAMKVVDSTQFTTTMKFPGVLPFLPNVAKDGINSYSTTQLYAYIDNIYKQSPQDRWHNVGDGTDTYWTGKAIARIAHLIPIADQVKHGAARDLFIAELKSLLNNWLDGKNPNLFYYNNVWKTLIGYPASYGSDTQINDHHFHYGYYVMAAAILANFDPVWAQESQWGGMINQLVKDTNNWDRNDQNFPFLRYYDIYAGHSWASGPAMFGSGNNEESSSEDFNMVTALILWGSLIENKAIRDLGIFLYTNQINAVSQYWFDIDNQIFPPEFQPVTLGIVWGDGGAYSIWWNGTSQELHGINFLPIQPGMLYLGQYPDYLKTNQTFMLNNGGLATSNVWTDIHMSVKALYDPVGAIADFNANPNYGEEAGDSHAHTYHWLHNINQLGRIDANVTANIPTYKVFNKNGIRTYVAYNPHSAPFTVTFSDGAILNVPAKTIITSNDVPTPPSEHTYTENAQNVGEVIFAFKPNWNTQFVKFNYEVNGSTLMTINMANNNGIWQTTLQNLKDGDTINYSYSYEDNTATITTQGYQHVYHSPSGPPIPPPSNVIDDTADYTLTADRIASGLKMTFIAKQNSTFVDLHYKVNGGDQLNYRMMNAEGTWTYQIPNLKDKDNIQFSFTYNDSKGIGHDTKLYTYAFSAATSQIRANALVHEASVQGIDKRSENELRFWFKPGQDTHAVTIHYTLDGQTQHTQRMNRRGEEWEFILFKTENSHLIDYFFSYEQDGFFMDTEFQEERLHSSR